MSFQNPGPPTAAQRTRGRVAWLIVLALVAAITWTATRGAPATAPVLIDAPVVDRADVLSPAAEVWIADRLRAHRDATGVQIAVLTVPTTHGVPIEDFSHDVARAWGGGRAGVDDGVLLTLALEDRRMRLEVGRGLEDRIFQRFAASPHGPRLLTHKPSLADTIRDRDALAAMPEGSLGRAFLVFLDAHGYQSLGILRLYHVIMEKWQREVGLPPLDDDRMWFVNRYMTSHDLQHIVTGYGPDEMGEAALSAFTLGQHYGFGLAVLTSGAIAHLGRQLGLPWFAYAWRAWRRGRRAQPLYAAPWEELLPLPLDLVREVLAIEPIDRAHPNGIWAANFNAPQGNGLLDEAEIAKSGAQ